MLFMEYDMIYLYISFSEVLRDFSKSYNSLNFIVILFNDVDNIYKSGNSRVNEHEQEETDQRVMTLFPALNLEALRVAADTLVPRFIPAIPKIVTKITSEVNNVSSSAELTQVV
ncbi:Hypothetical_protein [Hexamita inflata]|uniref:Hypothetical_protein n=1 Tax=Hexamita inflata TaxID=28002 RepID=A0AA86RQM8_9EUKA|nr:Hypothetical protein HINF_LOCUS63879 [Hexamita inflata]